MPYSEEVNALWDMLSDRPVGYHPGLARAVGGVKEGVFLCQLLYWRGKGARSDGYIWKTQKEIEEETGLTRYEQEGARERLEEIGVLEEKLMGIPARLHYRVNMVALTEAVVQYKKDKEAEARKESQTSVQETPNQDCGKPANKDADSLQTVHESTSESSSENTTRDSAGDPIKELIGYFQELRPGANPPEVRHPNSRAQERKTDYWIDPLADILKQADGDVHRAKVLMKNATVRLKDIGYTVSTPASLTNTVNDIVADANAVAGVGEAVHDPGEAIAMSMQRG